MANCCHILLLCVLVVICLNEEVSGKGGSYPCSDFSEICFAGNCHCRFGTNVTSIEDTEDCQPSCSGTYLCYNGECYCRLDLNGPTCDIQDSCASNSTIPCDMENGICVEREANSSQCACKPGWISSPDKLVCNDIDECTIEGFPAVCDEDNGICTNTNGSYICGCQDGFTLGTDNFTCIALPTVTLQLDTKVLRVGVTYTATCNVTGELSQQNITWFIGTEQIMTGIESENTDPGLSYSVLTFIPTADDHRSYLSCRSSSGASGELMLRVVNVCTPKNNVQTQTPAPPPGPTGTTSTIPP